MRRILDRGRIRGVSFHRVAPGRPRVLSERQPLSWHDLAQDIKKGSPPRLRSDDVRRLLGDHGHQEIHGLVSDAVEHCTYWRQVWRSLERSLHAHAAPLRRNDIGLGSSEELPAASEHATLVIEARHLFGLWHHRLEVLELIVGGQLSMRWEHLVTRKPPSRHR